MAGRREEQMDRALRVAEFDVLDKALKALAEHKVDVAVTQHTREGTYPYCLLYLLGSALVDILKATPFRWIFIRLGDESGFAVFEAEKMNAGKVFLVLADAFDIEFV